LVANDGLTGQLSDNKDRWLLVRPERKQKNIKMTGGYSLDPSGNKKNRKMTGGYSLNPSGNKKHKNDKWLPVRLG